MKENTFSRGILDGIPICLGYFAVSFAFGISAVSAGLGVLEATMMSLTNLTSAGQFAALPIIASGGGFIEMAVTQFIINLRYMLMSISLTQKFDKSVRFLDRFIIAFGVTDEIFGVSSSRKGRVGRNYMLGLIITPVLGWTSGTFLGAAAGNILPSVIVTALSLAIYGMFIAIVLPEAKKEKGILICCLIAIALGCMFKYIPLLGAVPEGFVIIICASLAAGIMAFIAPIKIEGGVA